MPFELPPECRRLIVGQANVIARMQALEGGLNAKAPGNRVRYGDWQRLQRGVYATYTGDPTREAQLWAALLRAGSGAVLSHYTAAERHGLLGQPSGLIHVTVPETRNPSRCGRIPGVVIHRSDAIMRTCHPAMTPPCTRVEDTVLDIIKISGSFDAKYDWICRAIGNRRTTAERLLAALGERKRYPKRRETQVMLGFAREGILSWLEYQWASGVERPHGLPSARRQVRITQETGNRYLDNLYEGYRICVELDGRVAHPESEQWRDKARDNWNLVHEKITTMRFGVADLRDQQHKCKTAANLAAVLSDHGPAVGAPCSAPGCPVPIRCP